MRFQLWSDNCWLSRPIEEHKIRWTFRPRIGPCILDVDEHQHISLMVDKSSRSGGFPFTGGPSEPGTSMVHGACLILSPAPTNRRIKLIPCPAALKEEACWDLAGCIVLSGLRSTGCTAYDSARRRAAYISVLSEDRAIRPAAAIPLVQVRQSQ